ncbi:MAG: tRNA (adenosine(37)-N6)-threonylcarbamoyltransferase complex dimerization subunit type 1 TsaB [Alphaproteobacteria bacterium]|nr:tRNA (adenosine(37)-N6)-threonylcarbamoyltransferase complex dimerization subunit type 1 TsaB [Alphaproteobacteria bacterium]
MNILAFDTCFDACSAAASRAGGKTVAARFEPMATGHAERLVPMIAEVMQEAGFEFSELERIAVTNGPGTFTGTRIGVAAARSLALAAAKPLVAATSLWVMAEEVADTLAANGETTATDIMIATDARRSEVYVQHFSQRKPLGEPALLDATAAARLLRESRACVLAGSGAEAVAAAAAEDRSGLAVRLIAPHLLPDARFLARLATRLEVTDCTVAPLYLRPADAKPQAGHSNLRAVP